MSDPYVELANAIIYEAAMDYKLALIRLKRHPDSKYAEKEIKKLEDFFYSSEYEMLTNLNPDYLIRKMKEEVANAHKLELFG